MDTEGTESTPYKPLSKTTTNDGSRMATTNTRDPCTDITPIFLLNIWGLLRTGDRDKFLYLEDLAACNQAICMVLTEMHLTSNIEDAKIKIPEDAVLRTNRKDRSHGGVAMYIRKDVTPLLLLSRSNSVCDTLIGHIKQIDVVVCSTYRPPNISKEEGKFEDSLRRIEDVLTNLDQHINILFLGDFNLPNVKWPEGHILSGMSLHKQSQAKSVLELSDMLFMEQVILQRTRGSNILDLCFTNNVSLIHNVKVTPTSLSDHNIKELTMCGPRRPADTHPIRRTQAISNLNFHRADWKSIRKEIQNQNWHDSLSIQDNDLKVSHFMSTIQDICTKYVPEGKANRIPRDRKILMRHRTKVSNQLNRELGDSKRAKLKLTLLEIENQIKLSHEKGRAEKEKRAVESIKTNPKAFYRFAKETATAQYKIGPTPIPA
ncbi:uncharacterized protein LOC118768055 [Octopus sinensis]|uniref:Uncharacterized protein LOC118768055 n=1 Tax=Octopus sinensis TaxID=2607531 RepID=A0A7E6FQ94_9MOLL|nr:uncharacterized protein LOC118768055 [Octopus sinensis]